MSLELRLPNITATTEAGKLIQIQSYLYQTVQQLNYALGTIEAGTSGKVLYTGKGTGGGRESGGVSPEDAAVTFNSLKGLIIKSADIVNAYYETMRLRMDGEYVAESDFGVYRRTTAAELSATIDSVNQLYTDLQSVEETADGAYDSVRAVTANIKTGLLYTNESGVPVYGLEVGQRNVENGVESFRKYARFTANRLSFYDQNDTEVAYISDYKLFITQAQITGSITLGRYVADMSDGLAFKWV